MDMSKGMEFEVNTGKIEHARILAGLKKIRLAEAVGVHPNTIYSLTNGKHQDMDTIHKVCKVLGLEFSDVISVSRKPSI